MNGQDGLRAALGSSLFVAGNTTLSLTANSGAGLGVLGVSQALVFASEQGPVSAEGNTGPGVNIVDSSSGIIIGAAIQNNGPPDVNLAFGARADLSNSTIAGTISCDGTEIIIGAMCSP